MMNKRPNLKNLVFLLLAAALLVTCRKTSRDAVIPVDPGLPLTVAQGPEIESYPFEDQGCQELERPAEDPALSPITEVSVNSWKDGSVVRKPLNTADLRITGFPLKSPLVTKSPVMMFFKEPVTPIWPFLLTVSAARWSNLVGLQPKPGRPSKFANRL